MAATILQQAYLLHRRPYRESSVILELFTPDHGRIAMVARGARGKKSALQPLLQLYRPLLISWHGRGPLYSLRDVEPGGAMLQLSGICLICGFYINELLVKLLHHEEAHPALYATYQLVLQQLADNCAGDDLEWLLRQFELRLLTELGYGLNLQHDAESGAPLQAEQRYHYVLEKGALPWCEGVSAGVPVHGATLMDLALGELNGSRSRAEAKRLMRVLLSSLLGNKPLHSRELLQNMMQALSGD